MQKRNSISSHFWSGRLLILFAVMALVLMNPFSCATGALQGLQACSSVVIPSLFPFTVLSLLFEKNGGFRWVGSKTNRFAKFFLGIEGEDFAILLLSLLCGYPVGANIINERYQKQLLTEEKAKLLLRFCINPSPAFFIGVIGNQIYQSQWVGYGLLLANLLACLFLTALFGKLLPKRQSLAKQTTFEQKPLPPFSDTFVSSVAGGAQVILSVSAYVVFFSSLSFLLSSWITNKNVFTYLSPLLEITLGCKPLAQQGVPPYQLSFFLCFGGLSTLFQIKQMTKDLSPTFFFFIRNRLLHGLTATLFSYLLFTQFPPTKATIGNAVSVTFTGIPFLPASLALLFGSILFLIYLQPQKKLPTL